MDTFLAIASRREVRDYADRDVPEDVVERILDAGRLAGSASNRQPWRFVVVASQHARIALLDAMLAAWVADLRRDGFTEEQITRRTRRGLPLRYWRRG